MVVVAAILFAVGGVLWFLNRSNNKGLVPVSVSKTTTTTNSPSKGSMRIEPAEKIEAIEVDIPDETAPLNTDTVPKASTTTNPDSVPVELETTLPASTSASLPDGSTTVPDDQVEGMLNPNMTQEEFNDFVVKLSEQSPQSASLPDDLRICLAEKQASALSPSTWSLYLDEDGIVVNPVSREHALAAADAMAECENIEQGTHDAIVANYVTSNPPVKESVAVCLADAALSSGVEPLYAAAFELKNVYDEVGQPDCSGS